MFVVVSNWLKGTEWGGGAHTKVNYYSVKCFISSTVRQRKSIIHSGTFASFLLQVVTQFEFLQFELLTLILVVGAIGTPGDEHVQRH